jgi:hypothetical protein
VAVESRKISFEVATIESVTNHIFTPVLTQMRKINWKARSLGVTLLVLLVVVLNPEIRALLMLLDFLGADLVLLLLSGYVSQYWPIFVAHLRPVLGCLARGLSSVSKSLRLIAYGLLPREAQWAQIDHIGIAGSVAARIVVWRLKANVADCRPHQA